MGCSCAKADAVSDPQAKQRRRDEELARRLQREEDRVGGGGGGRSGQAGGRQQQAGWNTAGPGRQLGGGGAADVSDAAEQAGAEERRQRALEAAEKRQVNLPGVSQQKAVELREKQQKEELLGKLAEYYNKKRMELPMGLNSATAEQLKKHWDHVRTGDPAAQVLEGR